jgi:hypothetical protein
MCEHTEGRSGDRPSFPLERTNPIAQDDTEFERCWWPRVCSQNSRDRNYTRRRHYASSIPKLGATSWPFAPRPARLSAKRRVQLCTNCARTGYKTSQHGVADLLDVIGFCLFRLVPCVGQNCAHNPKAVSSNPPLFQGHPPVSSKNVWRRPYGAVAVTHIGQPDREGPRARLLVRLARSWQPPPGKSDPRITSRWPTILCFKPTLLKQNLEARLRSEAIPLGIDRQEEQMDITR